ncbi:hypothetical protein RHSIM_Rhsim01G0178000 [Rhododendron simsii]|uniref:Uncharacterized protein n=1 Tax=Rhododendron simsii TaxID=118357 RepID=A0A834HEX7_RHOSS|nr:hypothetical protein RHSIM_Rhsim01G0178000 [Rhododendron simsii]
MACIANGVMVNVSSKMPSCGRKRIPIDFTKMRDIDHAQQTNIQSLAAAMKVPKTTIHRRIKEGKIRPHSNALKPYLSEQAQKARLQFCLSMLEPNDDENQPRKFKSMYNYVHIDEKWFYMTKEVEVYYLLSEEEEPHHTCKSKRFIPKVIILAAVAQPRFDANQNEEFLAAMKDGFDIHLSNQPPSSLDVNVLDLGYFRAIQSLQHQEAPKTVDVLVNAVEKSFEELSADRLNRVFIALQACMVEVIKVHGGNNYKLPHIGKNQLIRSAMLPSQLECESGIVESALPHLQNAQVEFIHIRKVTDEEHLVGKGTISSVDIGSGEIRSDLWLVEALDVCFPQMEGGVPCLLAQVRAKVNNQSGVQELEETAIAHSNELQHTQSEHYLPLPMRDTF